MRYTGMLLVMSELKEQPTLEDMTSGVGGPATPEHDDWVRRTVESRLAKKNAGKTVYRDLDEVAVEFGFHAR